ncbi:flagellar hook protein FlgE [Marinobacter bryozoorum]|uniref:flagellar hook protein FlgE n=1 Tax=Marinobacter bryozoorum TaxID=256324 RepID=UPI002004B495|nr:flagellar hook protein FlgE [Marinobacter bryozoorum]MCK7544659.1 flagellar hook protein FlgE [Marinobacter bryozoorum]
MAFNIGLSGLRASQVDLDVTGNNIANASTVGFKGSKAQFGDLYSSGFLSAGRTTVGSGVKTQDVKQGFAQGSISGTQNALDMAIDGDGFFILSNNGEVQYSRAGQFSIDKDGFVVNNQSMRVQGFEADEDGNLSGVRGDLQIDTDNLAPRRTTRFDSEVNLDSRESVLEVVRQTYDVTPSDEVGGEDVLTFSYDDNRTVNVTIGEDEDARTIAEKLNALDGVSASARTTYALAEEVTPGSSFTLQGSEFSVPDNAEVDSPEAALDWLQDAINASPLNSINATRNEDGSLQLIDSRGNNLSLQLVDADGNEVLNEAEIAGQVNQLVLDRSVSVTKAVNDDGDPIGPGNFLASEEPSVTRTNTFDPQDQRTYNHATSSTIYDSLGNPHTMTQYFVKEPIAGGDSVWAMYVQIDDEDVGDPPTTDGDPTRARYELTFNSDGSLASVDGNPDGQVLISNWAPKDGSGEPNGADGPLLVSEGADLPIADPPVSSNFMIDVNETTQYGSSFGVVDQRQNGYTTGRLSGLDVSDSGIIFARYTNGQSQNLGQVALASFANTNGLTPVGDTNWVETFESGQPIYGEPGTGTLGSISPSSVEESNVDLSQELVNLIIAQRNYQANAKTIETSDAVTQTIINLR